MIRVPHRIGDDLTMCYKVGKILTSQAGFVELS